MNNPLTELDAVNTMLTAVEHGPLRKEGLRRGSRERSRPY